MSCERNCPRQGWLLLQRRENRNGGKKGGRESSHKNLIKFFFSFGAIKGPSLLPTCSSSRAGLGACGPGLAPLLSSLSGPDSSVPTRLCSEELTDSTLTGQASL